MLSQVAARICSSPSLLWWNPESLTRRLSRSVKFDNTICVSEGTPSIQGNEHTICCRDSYQNSAQEHIIQPHIFPSASRGWKILSLLSSEASLGCQLRSWLPWNNGSPGWLWEPSPTHNRCGRKQVWWIQCYSKNRKGKPSSHAMLRVFLMHWNQEISPIDAWVLPSSGISASIC